MPVTVVTLCGASSDPPSRHQSGLKLVNLGSSERFVLLQDQMSLHVYSINGKHLVSQTVHSHINHLVVAEGFLITGNRAGVLGVKQLTEYVTTPRVLFVV